MTIDIVNQQRIKKINQKLLSAYLKKIHRYLGISSKKSSLFLCDNKLIKKLNKKYFKKGSSTDVISFPLSDELDPSYLGEVIVSVEKATQVARKIKVKWQNELLLYIVHGMLHLIGYEDRTEKQRRVMMIKEEEIIKKLSL
jgi:probable rRNA maturation factor